ncbi:MAG: flagellar biosynthesis protein FliQ [Blastocatellia bacterium]
MDLYIELAGQALILVLLLAAPPLLASLVVGLAVSLLQALTQVQEQTLTLVPKIFITLLTLLIFAGWMLQKLLNFTGHVFELILRASQHSG